MKKIKLTFTVDQAIRLQDLIIAEQQSLEQILSPMDLKDAQPDLEELQNIYDLIEKAV